VRDVAWLCLEEGLYADAVAQLVIEHDPTIAVCHALPDAAFSGPVPEGRVRVVLIEDEQLGTQALRRLSVLRQRTGAARVLAFGGREPGAIGYGVDAENATRVPKSFRRDAVRMSLALALGGKAKAPRTRAPADDDAPGSAREYGLTRAEVEVLKLAAIGLTNREIAERRKSSEGTVRNQMSAILDKLGVRSRGQAILLAFRMGLVGTDAFGGDDLRWLLPHMASRRLPAGHVLFEKGERADAMYLIQSGRVRLPEIGVEMGPGDWFGELGVLAPDGVRTLTAVCAAPSELLVLSARRMRLMFQVSPGFALTVLQLVTRRLGADQARRR
jgi:two-component system, NarL family, nitrate/nitrite response regulator NarL